MRMRHGRLHLVDGWGQVSPLWQPWPFYSRCNTMQWWTEADTLNKLQELCTALLRQPRDISNCLYPQACVCFAPQSYWRSGAANHWQFWSHTFFPRLPTLVIVYTIYSLLKPLHTVLTVSEKKTTLLPAPNIEFSQYKNCFINGCMFQFRWSYFVCYCFVLFL